MEFKSSRWTKLVRALAICCGLWIFAAGAFLIDYLPRYPIGRKEWILVIFVFAPGCALLEFFGESCNEWIGKRFSRFQIYGFLIVAGLTGLFLVFYFVPR